jgi:hypothetical protein
MALCFPDRSQHALRRQRQLHNTYADCVANRVADCGRNTEHTGFANNGINLCSSNIESEKVVSGDRPDSRLFEKGSVSEIRQFVAKQ